MCVVSIIWVDEVFHLLAAPSSPATDVVVVASAAAVAVKLLQERKPHRQKNLSFFFFFCLFCSLQSSFDWTLTRQTNRQSTFPRSGAELRRFNNVFNLCGRKAASSRLPASNESTNLAQSRRSLTSNFPLSSCKAAELFIKRTSL